MSAAQGFGLSRYDSAYNPLSSKGGNLRIKLGALSFVYVLHNITAMLLCASFSVYIAGLSKMLFNYANAFQTWTYWRFWGMAIFGTPLAFLSMFNAYQERKVASMTAATGSDISSTMDRTFSRIVYGMVTVVILLWGAYFMVTQTWISVDAGQCTSEQCMGPNLNTTPVLGMILVLAGGWAVIVFMIGLFLESLYIHAAARDLWTANHSVSSGFLATLNMMSAAIGDRLGIPVALEATYTIPFEDLQEHLDAMPLGAEPLIVSAAIGSAIQAGVARQYERTEARANAQIGAQRHAMSRHAEGSETDLSTF